jgi:uncharacterized protein (TIGR03067 family)
MRNLWLVSWVSGLILIPISLGTAADKADDAKQLQGSWMVVSAEAPDEQGKELLEAKLSIEGDVFTLKNSKREETINFRLDPGKKPKQIDFIDKNKEAVALGIYSLEGDTLKLCWGKTSQTKDRPTEFATKANGDLVFLVLKRDKK